MRPWESLSRRGGVAGGPGGRGRARAEGQAKLATRRDRLRQRNQKSQAILRVLGSFGISAAPDLGFVRVLAPLLFIRSPGSTDTTAPLPDAQWEFYSITAAVTTAIGARPLAGCPARLDGTGRYPEPPPRTAFGTFLTPSPGSGR